MQPLLDNDSHFRHGGGMPFRASLRALHRAPHRDSLRAHRPSSGPATSLLRTDRPRRGVHRAAGGTSRVCVAASRAGGSRGNVVAGAGHGGLLSAGLPPRTGRWSGGQGVHPHQARRRAARSRAHPQGPRRPAQDVGGRLPQGLPARRRRGRRPTSRASGIRRLGGGGTHPHRACGGRGGRGGHRTCISGSTRSGMPPSAPPSRSAWPTPTPHMPRTTRRGRRPSRAR
jgi:hypothetical protein